MGYKKTHIRSNFFWGAPVAPPLNPPLFVAMLMFALHGMLNVRNILPINVGKHKNISISKGVDKNLLSD